MPRAAAPTAPRFEHRTDSGPVLAVATPTPRLSWQIPTRRRRVRRDRLRGRGDAGGRRARDVPGRVGRPGARAVAGRADRVPAGGHRARAGPWRRRGVDRLERSGRRRGRPVPRRRLDGPVRQPAHARRPGGAGAAAAGRHRRAGRGGPGAALHHGARPLPRRDQRSAGRRRRAGARAGPAMRTGCATTRTTSPTWSGPATTCATSSSATAGTAGGSASAARAPSTATAWRCSPSSR